MAEPWIRVHAGLIDKPVIGRAVATLGISDHTAVGLLVTFWGSVSRNVAGGDLSKTTDADLEKWARWKGKRGRFAAFIRTQHLDHDQRVNEWDEYAGALEVRRQKERDRQQHHRDRTRDVRVTSRDAERDRTRDVTEVLQPARANETKTIRNERTSSSPSSARADLLSRVPHRLSWEAEMNAAQQGMHGTPPLTDEQVERAAREYLGNGFAANPSLKHFRGFLRNAAQPDTPPAARIANGARASPDPFLAALDDMVEREKATTTATATATAGRTPNRSDNG